MNAVDYSAPDQQRRIAIKQFCRRCRGVGQPGQPWRHAVARCTDAACPLHRVRPQPAASEGT